MADYSDTPRKFAPSNGVPALIAHWSWQRMATPGPLILVKEFVGASAVTLVGGGAIVLLASQLGFAS